MAKFFYNRVYNTKRMIINIIIISVCVIGIIVCFILTSNFQGENKNTPEKILSIKKEATVEVNEKFENSIFFSKIENVNLNEIEVIYPSNYDISKIGKYDITLKISGKNYTSSLNVIDTTKPKLTLKELTISEGGSYSVNNFVTSCTDNSNQKCNIAFYSDGIDEDGNKIDYSNLKKAGTYYIKIAAKDSSDNQTVEETKLTIRNSNNTIIPIETSCKYGDNTYDKDNYLVAIDITTNKCAVSLDLYKDSVMTAEINKMMETETVKIKRAVEALNLNGTLALNRRVTAVVNTSGNGIVGYELQMTVTITNNNEAKTVVEYKLDNNGKRVFITNPYNLN